MASSETMRTRYSKPWNLNREPNRSSMIDFSYIFGTVLFTVYGQLVVKWQVANAGTLPLAMGDRIRFLLGLLFNPWIMSGVVAGFLAMLCWMAAMTKFELSYAYPFMSLAFLLVLILSAVLFHEAITAPKVFGLALIIIGIIVASRG
jgi:drug/metabolite transporter (DMT)-like permease